MDRRNFEIPLTQRGERVHKKNHYHITLNENILLGVMKMEYQSGGKNAAPFAASRIKQKRARYQAPRCRPSRQHADYLCAGLVCVCDGKAFACTAPGRNPRGAGSNNNTLAQGILGIVAVRIPWAISSSLSRSYTDTHTYMHAHARALATIGRQRKIVSGSQIVI
jgi:hypothetical protein